MYDLWCDPGKNHLNDRLYFWVWIFHISKYYEFIDTIFIVFAKVKFPFRFVSSYPLQSLTSFFCFFQETSGVSSCLSPPSHSLDHLGWNSIRHDFPMDGYRHQHFHPHFHVLLLRCICSWTQSLVEGEQKSPLPLPLPLQLTYPFNQTQEFLTMGQMIQFWVNMIVLLLWEVVHYLHGCSGSTFSWFLTIFANATFYLLFLKFYRKTYTTPRSASSPSTKSKTQ
jgi:hypothetical protein